MTSMNFLPDFLRQASNIYPLQGSLQASNVYSVYAFIEFDF